MLKKNTKLAEAAAGITLRQTYLTRSSNGLKTLDMELWS